MCGIAGYSVRSRSKLDRTLAAQALLAAIAERGADAVGYAYRTPDGPYPTVVKQRTPASKLLERVAVPAEADQLLAPHSCARSEPRMTVDSEAIFALAAHSENDARAFERLRGAMATAWLDERAAGVVFVARGSGRPLWVGEGRDGVFFASTRLALEVVEQYCRLRLRKREAREGTWLALRNGEVVRRDRFRPDLDYVEPDPLPAVRAPGEREFCLTQLAALATP